jgi:hypothetical protein
MAALPMAAAAAAARAAPLQAPSTSPYFADRQPRGKRQHAANTAAGHDGGAAAPTGSNKRRRRRPQQHEAAARSGGAPGAAAISPYFAVAPPIPRYEDRTCNGGDPGRLRLPPGWAPPRSPYSLIEEWLWNQPWRMLVACILLNKTTAKQLLNNQVLQSVIDRWPGKGQRNVKAKRPGQRLPEPPALGLQQRMIWSRCSGPRCPAARERRAQHDTCSRELPKRGRGGALRG